MTRFGTAPTTSKYFEKHHIGVRPRRAPRAVRVLIARRAGLIAAAARCPSHSESILSPCLSDHMLTLPIGYTAFCERSSLDGRADDDDALAPGVARAVREGGLDGCPSWLTRCMSWKHASGSRRGSQKVASVVASRSASVPTDVRTAAELHGVVDYAPHARGDAHVHGYRVLSTAGPGLGDSSLDCANVEGEQRRCACVGSALRGGHTCEGQLRVGVVVVQVALSGRPQPGGLSVVMMIPREVSTRRATCFVVDLVIDISYQWKACILVLVCVYMMRGRLVIDHASTSRCSVVTRESSSSRYQ